MFFECLNGHSPFLLQLCVLVRKPRLGELITSPQVQSDSVGRFFPQIITPKAVGTLHPFTPDLLEAPRHYLGPL